MKSWQGLLETLFLGKLQKERWYRFMMITNQVNSLGKTISYNYAYSDNIKSEILCGLADLLAMTKALAVLENIDLEYLDDFAYNRLEEFIKTRLPK